jgi:hypothetical protein
LKVDHGIPIGWTTLERIPSCSSYATPGSGGY